MTFVLGTRHEAIKLAPVAQALANRGLEPLVIFTGQHPHLCPAEFRLDSGPALFLDCPGQDDPYAHVEAVTRALLPVLAGAAPDLLVVQGTRPAPLEGRLPPDWPQSPVPMSRRGFAATTAGAPGPKRNSGLRSTGIAPCCSLRPSSARQTCAASEFKGSIHVTGNSGVDALLEIMGKAAPVASGPPRLLVTCHRRENWGEGIDGIASAIRSIAADRLARVEIILHPNPRLSRRMRELLLGQPGIAFRPPQNHRETIAAMLRSTLILSDSGGMQEEAAVLGRPLLILRERTERPEAVACGSVELVGTDPDRILGAVKRRLNGAANAPASMPFGDGGAGERIAQIIDSWLGEWPELLPALASA